jgi:hypothetical protein
MLFGDECLDPSRGGGDNHGTPVEQTRTSKALFRHDQGDSIIGGRGGGEVRRGAMSLIPPFNQALSFVSATFCNPPPRNCSLDMRKSQALALVKSFVVNTARLFSSCSSQSENTAYLLSPNVPQSSVTDDNLPDEYYSEVVRRMLPPNCTSFQGDEVRVVGSTPIQAGGYTDVWEATLNGRNVVLESYRPYETGDIEHTSRVRMMVSPRTVWLTFCSRDTTQRFWHAPSSLIRISSHLLGSPPHQITRSPWSSIPLDTSGSENTSA